MKIEINYPSSLENTIRETDAAAHALIARKLAKLPKRFFPVVVQRPIYKRGPETGAGVGDWNITTDGLRMLQTGEIQAMTSDDGHWNCWEGASNCYKPCWETIRPDAETIQACFMVLQREIDRDHAKQAERLADAKRSLATAELSAK